MKYVVILSVIVLIIVIILKETRRISRSCDKSTRPDKVRKGCKSTKSCQYMDLGTAKKAGKSSDIVYCRYCREFLPRTDECDNYLSHGCANGICAHAGKSENGNCFCKYFSHQIQLTESCPHYLDFFDTKEGNNLLDSLNIK